MNNAEYIGSAIKQFQMYKQLGEQAMAQIPDDKLNWQYNSETNSVAIIVKHLWGNMTSRWVNFLTEDGEKPWRRREAEFDNDILSRKELLQKWEDGWQALFAALNTIASKPELLDNIIYIRNQGHSVMEAVNRQLSHYPHHVGQLLYIGKMVCGKNWKSLSIPRGKSDAYNVEKFSKPKERGHFSDEFLKTNEK